MRKKIETKCGYVSAKLSDSKASYVFKGIPYAKKPLGDWRWKVPQPVKPWEGELKADEFKPAAMQEQHEPGSFYQKEFYPEPVAISEDCLYLNIWVPAEAPSDGMPVMLWIHGGAFNHGFSYEMEFDGEGFNKRGVILVTISYRLGILGFMAHPELTKESEYNVSGNYGILDQIEAIKWVYNNISAFGGDKDNITVFGQSAGAMSVQTLISTRFTKGMIAKAIMQSGAGLWAVQKAESLKDAEKNGEYVSEFFGNASLEKLRTLPAHEFADNESNITKGLGKIMGFRPIVDGYVLNEDTNSAALSGNYHDIPYMIGIAEDEMTNLYTMPYEKFKKSLDAQFGDKSSEYAEIVKSGFSNGDFVRNPEFAGSLYAGTVEWAKMHDRIGKKPAYVYNFKRRMPGDGAGAFHSAELWYVFQTLDRCWRPLVEGDYKLSDMISDYWANFAKTGDPNSNELPEWTPLTNKEINLMVFDLETKSEEPEFTPLREFFREMLFEKYDIKDF